MKACILVILSVAWSGTLIAAPPEPAPKETKPDQNLGEIAVQQPVQLEKAIAPEDKWTEAKHGVIGQFIEAPNVLAPVNLLAKPEAGMGEANLNRDPITGRVMGLNLLAFDF